MNKMTIKLLKIYIKCKLHSCGKHSVRECSYLEDNKTTLILNVKALIFTGEEALRIGKIKQLPQYE